MDTNSQKEDGRIVLELILATRNTHKTREFRELLGDEFEVTDLCSFPGVILAAETGRTFAENAILKAVELSKGQSSAVIADDSGLEVDALEGAPGIFSARYAGENATDAQNIDKLLRILGSSEQRSARFRCTIALAQNGKINGTFEGTVEGKIVERPRGNLGFGYDPIFQPSGCAQTFGEMPSAQKNEISHRAKAAAKLRDRMRRKTDPGREN